MMNILQELKFTLKNVINNIMIFINVLIVEVRTVDNLETY